MLNQKLINYIKNSLDQGKSKETIFKELLEDGWSVDFIQEHFNAVISEQEKEDISRKTIRILVIIGAILIGVGIFSFITANWQKFTRPMKIFIILAGMLVSYCMGWYFKEKKNLLKTGEALILLGVIIYGTGIFLVAQMFHFPIYHCDGFLLWMIGTIAMGFVLESYLLYRFSMLLGLIAISKYPFTVVPVIGSDPLLWISSFLFLIATVITFMIGLAIYRKIPSKLRKFYS